MSKPNVEATRELDVQEEHRAHDAERRGGQREPLNATHATAAGRTVGRLTVLRMLDRRTAPATNPGGDLGGASAGGQAGQRRERERQSVDLELRATGSAGKKALHGREDRPFLDEEEKDDECKKEVDRRDEVRGPTAVAANERVVAEACADRVRVEGEDRRLLLLGWVGSAKQQGVVGRVAEGRGLEGGQEGGNNLRGHGEAATRGRAFTW
jgi:hypothetical protein